MSKRLFVLLAVLVSASMMLAACGGGPAAYTCTDKIGCVTIAPTDPIHIAYLLVVSGPNETLGVDSRNGIEIAIDDAGGKILNHAVKFDGEDGGCDAGPGQTAGTKLSADTTIVAVIGTSCSSEARAAVPLLSKAGFVIISPSNTAPDLTEAGNANNYPGYLRTAHNDKAPAPTRNSMSKRTPCPRMLSPRKLRMRHSRMACLRRRRASGYSPRM